MNPEQKFPHGSSFKFYRVRDTPGVTAFPNHQVLQTLKEHSQLAPYAPTWYKAVRVCQGHGRTTEVTSHTWAPRHEPTCHGISKSRHHAAAEGMCLPGGRAGTTGTQSLINGREMLFPLTWEPRSAVFSTSSCSPLFPASSSMAVCSSPSTSMQQRESDCLSQWGLCCCTGKGASLGLASLTKLPLEAATGETLTNVGTQVWGSRWGAGSQVNKLCTLDVELDGSTVGSLEASLSSLHHARFLSHGSSTERQTCSWLGRSSWWK